MMARLLIISTLALRVFFRSSIAAANRSGKSNQIHRNIQERDRRPISISTAGEFVGVPLGMEVDINSTIEIQLKKDEVRLPQESYRKRRMRPSSKSQKLRTTLDKLSAVVDARPRPSKRIYSY